MCYWQVNFIPINKHNLKLTGRRKKQIYETYVTWSQLPLKYFFNSPTFNALHKQLILLTSMQTYLLSTVLTCKLLTQWPRSFSSLIHCSWKQGPKPCFNCGTALKKSAPITPLPSASYTETRKAPTQENTFIRQLKAFYASSVLKSQPPCYTHPSSGNITKRLFQN